MPNLSRYTPWIYFFTLLFAFSTNATSLKDVVVNEIAWMGTKIDSVEQKNWWRYEWLELYNNTNQDVSLDNWKIELSRANLDWQLTLKGLVQAKSYFLIVSSDKIFPDYDLNYSNLGGKLNNNGQKIVLEDNSNNIIDEVDCFSSGKWFAGNNETKQTMERKSAIKNGSDVNNWAISQNQGGTPKAKNSAQETGNSEQETIIKEQQLDSNLKEDSSSSRATTENNVYSVKPASYPAGIIFNEILPSPRGADEENEYIEIFNQNDFKVDLSGWKIKDAVGQTNTYFFATGTSIEAKGFLALLRPITKITLNNDRDELNLWQPEEKTVDTISYEKAPLNLSYNKTISGWVWSKVLTPGSENIISSSSNQSAGEKTAAEQSQSLSEKDENQLKTSLASLNQEVSQKNHFPLVALISLMIAVFSGIIILVLKKKVRKTQTFTSN